MALDATVGSIMANSYVTVEEADAYFLDRVHNLSWDSLLNKEQLLVTASRILDWQLVFSGAKTSDIQAMQFPRTGIIRRDGTEVPINEIPREVKFATFELALTFISKDRTTDQALAGFDQVKVGPLFVKSSGGGYTNTDPKVIPDHIKKMLSEFLVSAGISVVRLLRA